MVIDPYATPARGIYLCLVLDPGGSGVHAFAASRPRRVRCGTASKLA